MTLSDLEVPARRAAQPWDANEHAGLTRTPETR